MFSARTDRSKTHGATPIIDSLRAAFGFRLKRRTTTPSPYQIADEEDEHQEFVWDVPDPFAPLDPTQARLHALIQAEIARMRRYESIAPLQSLPDHHDGYDDDDEYPYSDADFESDDEDEDVDNASDGDADDEDDEEEDSDGEDSDGENKRGNHKDKRPNLIVLPPRYIPSPTPSPPPPSPSSDTASTDDGDRPALWHDLARVYNDLAEAEERARKAKRDAYRSRVKPLAA